MTGVWADFRDCRYLASGAPPRAVVEQFAEEEFGHPTAWVWIEVLEWTFRVATDPRNFRLRLMGSTGEEVFVVQVSEKR